LQDLMSDVISREDQSQQLLGMRRVTLLMLSFKPMLCSLPTFPFSRDIRSSLPHRKMRLHCLAVLPLVALFLSFFFFRLLFLTQVSTRQQIQRHLTKSMLFFFLLSYCILPLSASLTDQIHNLPKRPPASDGYFFFSNFTFHFAPSILSCLISARPL
jgi:hypothetical protein